MQTESSQKIETNSSLKISVSLRAPSKPSKTLAYADVTVEFGLSKIEISGMSVVRHDPEKPAWVSYPQRAGKNGKKFYSVVRVVGALHEKISRAVLAEYKQRPPLRDEPPEQDQSGSEQIPF